MGSSTWSDDVYNDRNATRAKTGQPVFQHTANVQSGKVAPTVHKKLNPLGVKMRESRDSDGHPESLGIAVFFDETGSMGQVPIILQKKLAGLMALLIEKGFALDPQILFGAIGDANPDGSEVAPLQIGQFESGIEMEDDLANIYLEGNGGGQGRETYELAHYWAARHTSIDCFEKRGKKGYFFTIGDEGFYPTVFKKQVKRLIGDDLESDIPTKDIVRELEQRYHVFHIIAEQGGYPHNPTIEAQWKGLLQPERVLKLEDSNLVAELIATTIGLTEGATDLDGAAQAMKDIGLDDASINGVTSSLVAYSGGLAKAGTAVGVDSSATTVRRI